MFYGFKIGNSNPIQPSSFYTSLMNSFKMQPPEVF